MPDHTVGEGIWGSPDNEAGARRRSNSRVMWEAGAEGDGSGRMIPGASS